jgi:hypothetical protein
MIMSGYARGGDSTRTRRGFRGDAFEARDGVFRGLPLLGKDDEWYRFEDEFLRGVNSSAWAEIDSPTVSILDDGATPAPETGVMLIEVADTDNTDGYVQTTSDVLKPAAGKSFAVETRIYFTEATANAGNFIFGFHEEFADGVLQNDGAGLNSGSVDAIVLVKKDGNTTWDLELANGATTASRTGIITATAATYVRLGLRIDCNADDAVVRVFADGKQVARHTITLTSLGSMKLGFGLKAGASEDQDLNVDYVKFIGER